MSETLQNSIRCGGLSDINSVKFMETKIPNRSSDNNC